MSKLRDILFSFGFLETVRSDLVFSDATKVRLDPVDHLLKLKAGANGAYPLDADLSIMTQEFWPRTNKAWSGFFASVTTPAGTSLGYKLNDGADDYWYFDRPSSLLLLAQYNDLTPGFALDYYRDGSAPSVTPVGSPTITAPGDAKFGAGALNVIGGVNGVDYVGAQLAALQNTGMIRFRVKPNYSGAPATDQTFFVALQTPGGENLITMGHAAGTGVPACVIGNDGGGITYFGPVTAWSPVAGTWHEFEVTWDINPDGFGAVFRIDGITFHSAAVTGSRTGAAIDAYSVGTYFGATADFMIDEIQVYDDVQHTADYTPETYEMPPDGWSIAPLWGWSTEEQIADGIATFPAGKLYVVVNLVTTDATVTPVLEHILVGYSAQIVFLEQWIYRTLVPQLREGCRPYAHWAIPIGATTSTIDLNSYRLDAPFNLIGIDSVYNHDTDPDHLTDILYSYDTGTKIITLSTEITAGEVAWINFTYEPEVAVLTSTDYHELGKVPALTLENLRVSFMHEFGHVTGLVNKSDGTAAAYETPWQCCLEGDIKVHAPRGLDEMALAEEVLAFLSDNQTITIRGTGEKADWMLKEPYDRSSNAELNDLRVSSIAFKLFPLRMWLKPRRTAGVFAVTGMKLGGDVNVVI